MSYLTKSLGFATHKVNRKFTIKVRLSFNEDSWNRDDDDSPRFWLDAQSIVYVENIAFTNKSLDKGYNRTSHRLYDNMLSAGLSQAETEAIFEDLKDTYPYGFRENDLSSKQKYIADARDNDVFQSHWANYWADHTDDIVPVSKPDNPTYPYIEFETTEIVATKHKVGTVPEIEGGGPVPVEQSDYVATRTYRRWNEILSDKKIINVSITSEDQLTYEPLPQEDLVFSLDGVEQRNLILDSESEQEYALRFVAPWPTGANGEYSGVSFRLSQTHDGENEAGGTEFFDASGGSFEHQTVSYVVTVANNGTMDVFYLDGVEAQALTLERGSEYLFDITDVTLEDHEFHISTSSVGGDNGAASYCHVQEEIKDEDGIKIRFRVPFDAPNGLYYQCGTHTGMGAAITMITPTVDYPAQSSSYADVTPGDGLKVMFPAATSDRESFYYYSTLNPNMGGGILSRKCSVKCPGASPKTYAEGWSPTAY